MVSIVLMGETVMAHGTAEQKDEHLAPTLRGERVWCQLFSEPGAGSDLASLSTKATLDGDEYVVTGQKVRSEEHTSELQSLMRISYAVICLKKKIQPIKN